MVDQHAPIVSVVMPNYNKANFVVEAIHSVLAQTLVDFELIVVDDASTDGSEKILSSFSRVDSRIKNLVNDVNRGPAFSINRGLSVVKGRYITFLGSDDLFAPNRLEKMVRALESTGRSIVYTYLYLIDDKGRTIENFPSGTKHFPPGGNVHTYVIREWIWGAGTIMMPISALSTVGYFDESLRWGEDFDYLLRLTSEYKIVVIPENLYGYRRHASSISGLTETKLKEEAYIRVFESELRRSWNKLDEPTKYWIMGHIIRMARSNKIVGKQYKWMVNPTFVRLRIKRLLGSKSLIVEN